MNVQQDEEFRDFMRARWPAMVRLAYVLTGDQGHAEDVAQTAFARAYASWPNVRRTGNPEAYVRRIVINENRNRFRKHRVAERLTDAPPESGTAHSRQGDIATAVSFNDAGGLASFGTWLRPGQHGLARASGRIGSGSYLGGHWSVTAYLGPWGVCLEAEGGSGCVDATSVSGLGTKVMFWAAGVPGVAGGSAGASVVRIVVTSPDGKTVEVHPVTVGGAKFFAFAIGQGSRPWKWTAYDRSGKMVASSTVTPG